jgi:type IV secretion system protein VirB2
MAVAPPAWQAPFSQLLRSVTGPIAFGISVVAIVGAGSVLLWGGEISEFVRRMTMLILVVGATMFSVAIIETLFHGSAAVIPH